MNLIQDIKRKYRSHYIMKRVYRARRYRYFFNMIEDILEHSEVQKLKEFMHHAQLSVYDHSLHVAYWNYRICSLFKWDVKAATRAGMLHDMFMYDWHKYRANSFFKLHGFVHAGFALEHAKKNFDLSKKEEDIISKHMFPLNIALPKYRETWVIVIMDKLCAMSEVMRGWVHSKPGICKEDKYKRM